MDSCSFLQDFSGILVTDVFILKTASTRATPLAGRSQVRDFKKWFLLYL